MESSGSQMIRNRPMLRWLSTGRGAGGKLIHLEEECHGVNVIMGSGLLL